MNKSDLITAIAEHANLTKTDAGHALDGLTKTIEATLKAGDSVALIGFGTFEVKERAERAGRNPQTAGTGRDRGSAARGTERPTGRPVP